MTTDLDLTHVDGPHDPERTAAAARIIADAVRYLNHATLPANGAPGMSYAGDVDTVIAHLSAAASGLRQTLDQLDYCLRQELRTGRLRLDQSRPLSDNPAEAMAEVQDHLADARTDVDNLQSERRHFHRRQRSRSWPPMRSPPRAAKSPIAIEAGVFGAGVVLSPTWARERGRGGSNSR